jgi:hypothetical protein
LKKVGAFLLETTDAERGPVFDDVKAKFEEWLMEKGELIDNTLTMKNGRIGDVSSTYREEKFGKLFEITLREDIPAGKFETKLSLGASEDKIELDCQLSFEHSSGLVTPAKFDVRCPNVIRNVVSMPILWKSGKVSVNGKKENVSDEMGAQKIAKLIKSKDRNIPLVLVSTYDDVPLHPELAEKLAADLCGLASVVEINDKVAWEITKILGREWSCYGGAIRLYWPVIDREGPLQHPLWTAQKILSITHDTSKASSDLRNRIRREVVGIASFAIRDSPLISKFKKALTDHDFSLAIKKASESGDYSKLEQTYANENDGLRKENEDLRKKINELKQELYVARLINGTSSEEAGYEPVTETPPATLLEAIGIAKQKWSDSLIFADNIEKGPETVDEDAGPPAKVLEWLGKVAEVTKLMRQGPLNKTLIQWFQTENIEASPESYSTQNDRKKYDQRKFPVGGEFLQFDTHLKPADATSPNRCVRIYFDWSKGQEKMVIGWIGKHFQN